MKSRQLFWVVALWLGALLNAPAAVLYVDLSCTNPIPPYADWSSAATNIQDAVDMASPGDTVLVTNGVYATGGGSWYGSTNRVTLTNAITLQSVNGPAVTLIVGNQVAGYGSALTNAVRCVGMGNGAVLSGFTLTNGEGGFGNYPGGGGVAYVYGSNGGTVTNCVLVGNLATNAAGGGAYRVTLINCQIIGNNASTGGGACACTLIDCVVVSNAAVNGGGVFGGSSYGASFLSNCVIAANSASSSGGGVDGGTLNACSVSNNTAVNGGGAYSSVLCNSLVVGNSATSGGGLYGGVATNCTVVLNSATSAGGGIYGGTGAYGYNSIFYYNNAPTGPDADGTKFNYSCLDPNPYGGGITNEPLFVDMAGGDFRLQSNSPCINSGNNAFVTSATDLDGNPRIAGGTVDIGAYEYQTPSSVLSYAWAQQYGLPTDGSVDYTDLDGTGFNVYEDWFAGLDPTNPASVLAMAPPPATNNSAGLRINWQSVNTRWYYLERATDLTAAPAFSVVQSNIVGQAGTTGYTDATATNGGPYFYRAGVQLYYGAAAP